MKRPFLLLVLGAAGAMLVPISASAIGDAPNYDSAVTSDKPAQWGFGTPEEDARPGQYYFYRAVDAVKRRQYHFAIDMYETSAAWGYKPAQYNLAVMYMKGDGVEADKPRAMAWAALAAERNDRDYVDARELIYSELTPEEFARANEIWRELKTTYGDATALARAKARWAQVRAAMTGSRVGSPGALRVGTGGYNGHLTDVQPGGKPVVDANTFAAFGVLKGGSVEGATAYRQLRESDNPYDPKFEDRTGTTKVGPLEPISDPPASGTPRNF